MQISIEKEQANRLYFSVVDITPTMANAIRRYSMMRVPTIAIESVTFYDNTSSIFDEYLAHRLGLMPIETPEKLPEDVEVIFSLDESGPKKIYSKDMRSSDKSIKVTRDTIPIITLNENQRLRFEAKAKLGLGLTHARHQAGLVSYGIEGDKFKFLVESFYHMNPHDILIRGCDQIEKDISEIKKQLKSGVKKK